MSKYLSFALLLACMGVSPAVAHECNGLEVEILVNNTSVAEYLHNSVRYIEALKGEEFSIRLTNHLDSRAAVALSVDGLNSIDARHTEAFQGKKWVLYSHQTIVISGWQINGKQARRFFFTTEDESYGRRLGQTANLGVISAVLFREKPQWVEAMTDFRWAASQPNAPSSHSILNEARSEGASTGAPHAPSQQDSVKGRPKNLLSGDEYAATGIGRQFSHQVQWVSIELEPVPVSTVNLRYEFRPVLAKLGVLLPSPRWTPLERRQRASGFSDSDFCPNLR